MKQKGICGRFNENVLIFDFEVFREFNFYDDIRRRELI